MSAWLVALQGSLSCMQMLSLSVSEMGSEPVLYVHNLAFKRWHREGLLPQLKLMNHGEATYMHVN